jgi:5-(carboxyamino)imidazole ribonucleotide mutase
MKLEKRTLKKEVEQKHIIHNKVKKILIIIGSASDVAVLEKLFQLLQDLNIPYDVEIASAHRDEEKVKTLAKTASKNGYGVIITAAGMANALSGTVAALATSIPVIGIPISKDDEYGVLYSTMMMPPGTVVLSVGFNAAVNAGLGAAKILAIHDEKVLQRIEKWQEKETEKRNAKNAEALKLFPGQIEGEKDRKSVV